jgi:hypothetical protein
MRKAVLSMLLFLMAACSQQDTANEKNVTLSSGEKGTVFLEEQTIDDERVLVIDYRSDNKPSRESEIDQMAEDIWSGVKGEADARGLQNALIKIRVPMPSTGDGSARQYNGLLFEAEKIENGAWKLKKVN